VASGRQVMLRAPSWDWATRARWVAVNVIVRATSESSSAGVMASAGAMSWTVM
jgi:hypothetical protein